VYLSKEKGVNAHLTVCPRCGEDGEGLILTGNAHKYVCSCGKIYIGKDAIPWDSERTNTVKRCSCGSTDFEDKGEPDTYERLPMLCKKCREELEMFNEEIKKGGIPFRCMDCKAEGVFKADSEFAKDWNKKHKGQGVSFKTDCPRCGVKKEEK